MQTCDVLIAGGGPAGSTCAAALRLAGLDVVVVDKAIFPRDKVCAGWITPQVVTDLRLDVDDYRRGRTFQPFTGFRVGLIGGRADVDTTYDHPVSFGVRRCEFDEYLLRRSRARLQLGTPVSSIRRGGGGWIVNECFTAPMLVGAGGHFCPVARLLNGRADDGGLVVAQEAEFAIAAQQDSSFTTLPGRPELYFSRALDGYGWCVRKQHYMNIGYGHLGRHGLPTAVAAFATFLAAEGKIPDRLSCHWKGHAYRLSRPVDHRDVGDGVLLVGDAAGLAYPQSGEGIRPAIESGLLAASTIIDAHRHYTSGRLASYHTRLRERFGSRRGSAGTGSHRRFSRLEHRVAPWMLRRPWFVRHVVLDRWFLHAHEPALAAS